MNKMQFLIGRINEINDMRAELKASGVPKKWVDTFDRNMLRRRSALEDELSQIAEPKWTRRKRHAAH